MISEKVTGAKSHSAKSHGAKSHGEISQKLECAISEVKELNWDIDEKENVNVSNQQLKLEKILFSAESEKKSTGKPPLVAKKKKLTK